MPQQVKTGVKMASSFASASATLIVLPVNSTTAEGTPPANIINFNACVAGPG